MKKGHENFLNKLRETAGIIFEDEEIIVKDNILVAEKLEKKRGRIFVTRAYCNLNSGKSNIKVETR